MKTLKKFGYETKGTLRTNANPPKYRQNIPNE